MDVHMPEETKDITITIRVKASIKDKAVKLARKDGRSLTNYLERLIEREWAKRK
jgi:predicted HicB family RNase H-like nuclease